MRNLDVAAANISTVIWATGFAFDFSWIDAPGGFDEQGYPRQHRGVSSTPGLYYLGLNWLSKRKSGIIFGVEEDAEHLGELIAQRVHYRDRRRA